jgi:hypothetical protein
MRCSARIAAAQLAGGLSTGFLWAGRRLAHFAGSTLEAEPTRSPAPDDGCTDERVRVGSSVGMGQEVAMDAAGLCVPKTAAGHLSAARSAARRSVPGTPESCEAWIDAMIGAAYAMHDEGFEEASVRAFEAAGALDHWKTSHE